MGKKPFFGMVSFCWLGLALAGCDTFNSNSVPKDRYQSQARPTFGNTNKDTTMSKGSTTTLPDSTVQTKPTDPRFVQDRPTGFDTGAGAVGTGGMTTVPTKPAGGFDSTHVSGQRSPGA